jgi:hypothetical protein
MSVGCCPAFSCTSPVLVRSVTQIAQRLSRALFPWENLARLLWRGVVETRKKHPADCPLIYSYALSCNMALAFSRQPCANPPQRCPIPNTPAFCHDHTLDPVLCSLGSLGEMQFHCACAEVTGHELYASDAWGNALAMMSLHRLTTRKQLASLFSS